MNVLCGVAWLRSQMGALAAIGWDCGLALCEIAHRLRLLGIIDFGRAVRWTFQYHKYHAALRPLPSSHTGGGAHIRPH
jgi:hypothetical protein